MQLTRYSDYSLRVLMYLAIRPEELATVEEVSNAYDISKAHLMKVVQGLGRARFVDTLRGRGGGFRLARAPEDISIGEVVRFTEERIDLVECFDPAASACRIEPSCRLKGVLEEAVDAFFETLDRYTLADLLARRREPLARLLMPTSTRELR